MAKIGINSGIIRKDLSDISAVLQANNIYNRSDIQWYHKFNRFGCIDPYNALGSTREYLFFTKPDLHIFTPGTHTLNPQLSNQPFFVELSKRYPEVITQLQKSIYNERTSGYYPFINILSNSVKNTLDLPAITTTEVDTPANIYGTSIDYRGSGLTSDEKIEFSLEVEDTKYLEIYHMLKAYEEYERLKKIGVVSPPNTNNAPTSNGYSYNNYIQNKELHDQFGVYKFIVDDDFETILYYAYLTGVFFKNVPRDAFSDLKVEGGLRYNIEFKAQFVDDMNPLILSDFNTLINNTMSVPSTVLPIYRNDSTYTGIDGRWATVPYIAKKLKSDYNAGVWLGPNSMQYDYKLTWRVR